MPKKKKSYKKCSIKGCRKKAVEAGKCDIHAKAKPKKSTIKKSINTSSSENTSAKTINKKDTGIAKKSKKECRGLNRAFYGLGVAVGRINQLIEK